MGDRLGVLLGSGTLDESFWSGLEETLIAADVGVSTASAVVQDVRRQRPEDGDAARQLLEESLIGQMSGRDRSLHLEGKPAVVLVVGVNGTGKTTSIAKIAGLLGEDGRTAVLGAADTFRAAADEQLRTWAERVGVEVVSGARGSDPAAVAYDAYRSAADSGADVVLVDTAGRLHSKTNLMDELGKVARVLRREAGDIGEVLLVLDGTTGQNGIGQARSFTEAVGVTGIVLTKLDGTSRGGVAVAVEQELDVPVKYIGVGEGLHDLVPFEPRAFIEALLEP
ncbi:MAG: signal recognition particle-docking protein FtsY [Actinomycetota bacterium]|nr:signal recognition particle-docking protein FtsY [Actinomycetota bacterium]